MEKCLKKVLLVDDEQLMINSMKTLIDWKAHGFSIVATAHNGKRALEYYKQLRPELVITDVVMPIMDGLELIKEIRTISEETYILILTAYDEFEYAKKALQNGVADYILKTEIAKDTFYEKLTFIHQKLDSRNASEQYVSNMELQTFFNSPPEQDEEEEILISHNFPQKRYTFFVLSTHQPLLRSNTHRQVSGAEQTKKRAVYGQQIKLLSACPAFIVFVGNYVILAVSIKKPAKLRARIARSFAGALMQQQCVESHVFYCPVSLKLTEFRSLFYENYSRLEFFSHFGKPIVMDLYELEPVKISPIRCSLSYPNLCSDKEAEKKWEEAVDTHLKYLFDSYDFTGIDSFFKGFCHYCESTLGSSTLFEPEVFVSTREELVSWVISEWHRCVCLYENGKRISYSPVVAETLEVIHSRYSEMDMSIKLLSINVDMSPGRLAQRFREEVGKTINEYLTDIRVDAAAFLLKNTNEKVYDIAEKVGYGSSQYFSQVFYRKTGQKPLDLRRREEHEK